MARRAAGGPRIAVGGAGAVFVGVAVAATGGPVPLAVEGSNAWSVRLPIRDVELPQPEGADTAAVPPPDSDSDSVGADVAEVLAQVAVLLVVAALVYLVGRAVVRAVRLSSGARRVAPPAQEAPPTGTREVAEAVDEGLDALADGPVDDVIVACWVRLEDAAAAAGSARRPSETSAELAVRVLTSFHAPPDAVDRLLELYRAARYSRHPLGEDDRAAATAALGDIRRSIGRVPA